MSQRSRSQISPILLAAAVLAACDDGSSSAISGGTAPEAVSALQLELPVRATAGPTGLLGSLLVDVDGDGVEDLVEFDSVDMGLRLARGLGVGAFELASGAPTPGFPLAGAQGDFDGDGIDEVAVVCVASLAFSQLTLGDLTDFMGAFAGGNAVLAVFGYDAGVGGLAQVGESVLPGAALSLASARLGQLQDTILVPLPSERALELYRIGPMGLMPVAQLATVGEFGQGTPVSALALDVDGDGDDDLLVGETDFQGDGPGSVSVFRALEPGVFEPLPDYSLGLAAPSLPLLVRVADLDADAAEDVVALDVREGADAVQIYESSGGSLSNGAAIVVGDRCSGAAVADFDGDGSLEMALAVLDASEVRVFSLSDYEALAPGLPLDLGPLPRGMAAIDLDSDGFPDLAAHHATGTTFIPGGPQGLGCTRGFELAPNSHFLREADLDGDGLDDALTLDLPQRRLVVHRGLPSGDLEPVLELQLTQNNGLGDPDQLPNTGGFALGDLDGDGDLDLVAALYGEDRLLIFENQGDFQLVQTDASIKLGDAPLGIVVGDFDRDGRSDLAIGNTGDDQLQLLWGTGSLGFGALSMVDLGARPLAMHAADLDGDGDEDLVVTADQGDGVSPSLRVVENLGERLLVERLALELPRPSTQVEAGDLDGDGRLELVANLPGDDSRELAIAASGTGLIADYSLEILQVLGDSGQDVDPATFLLDDVDADGVTDLLVVAASGRPVLMRNSGDASFAEAPLPGEGALRPALPYGTRYARRADIDGDGASELIFLAPDRPRLWVAQGVSTSGE